MLSSSSSGNVNNGSSTTTLTLNDADGAAKLDGKRNPATLHDYVLLYDEASRVSVVSFARHIMHTLSALLDRAVRAS